MGRMTKAEGAFLTIGELSQELGVAQHILRYWETRFPQLRPLQRSGNRRYYRPGDVAVARRIHQLLNVEGFTVRGAQRALAERPGEGTSARVDGSPPPIIDDATERAAQESDDGQAQSVADRVEHPMVDRAELIARLAGIRDHLAEALEAGLNG